MIIHRTLIILAIISWKNIVCEDDIVGVPLLPYLHLAKAKAMHNLAVEKAKLHLHPHLLLEANPEYHQDSSIALGIVVPHLSGHSSSPYSDNSNIASHYNLKDALKHYAYENPNVGDRNPVQADKLIFENRYESKEYNQTRLHQNNLLETSITDRNTQVENTDQSDSESFKADPGKFHITSLHDTKSNEHLYTLGSKTLNNDRMPAQEIGSNINDTQTPTTHQKPAKETYAYEDDEFFDKDSEEFIDENKDELDNSKVKKPAQKLVNIDIQRIDFLKKAEDNTESYLVELTNPDPRIGNPNENDLVNRSSSNSQTPNSNTYFKENPPIYTRHDANIKIMDNPSTLRLDEDTTTTPLNIFTQNPELNEDIVKPPKSISKNDDLKINISKNSNANTKPEDKLNDDQFDKVLNDDLDMLSLLASTHTEEDPGNTEQPSSFLQNFDTVRNYTKMPLEVFLPEEHQPNPNQNEDNPIVQDDLTEKNKHLDYQKSSLSYGDIQSRLIAMGGQYSEELNPRNVYDSNILHNYQQEQQLNSQFQHSIPSTPFAPSVNHDQLPPHSVMRSHQSPNNIQPNTNYEIYSRNRNFNNRFRDEQLYLWNLNNIKDNQNILQSPYSDSSPAREASPQKQFHIKSKLPSTILNSFRPNFQQYSNDKTAENSFNRLKQYINNFREISEKHSRINSKPYQSSEIIPRQNEMSREPNEVPSELVSAYLLHFPSNQAYFGERYRREIKGLTKTKLVEKERRAQLPLISLILDPYARLDVPKTIKNLGTVTRKSLEDKKAPMHHFSKLLASVKDAALATLKIPPQDLLIPSKYKIINKNALSNEMVGSSKLSGESAKKLGDNSLVKDDVTKVFHKVGSMLRQSVESGQQALQHVTDVGQNARKIISSTRKSLPNLLIPYIKAPEVIKTAKGKKLTMIAPRFADVGTEALNSHEDDYVKVGNMLEALSLSHPEQEEVGTMKITIQPKSKEPKLQSRFGETDEPEDPGYYVINNHLEGNALNPEEVHEVIEIFHTIKEIGGAKSLKNFLKNVKIQLINCTQNLTIDDDDEETVGNYWKFTRAMVEPFMGIFQYANKTMKRKEEKYKRAAPKRNFDNVENANFVNFLTGFELVSAINPEMYRTYFHEPLQIDHSKDVNLQEIQHEIKNANLLVVPPLLKAATIKSAAEKVTASNEDNQQKNDEEIKK